MHKHHLRLVRRLYDREMRPTEADVKRLAEIAAMEAGKVAGDPTRKELAEELRDEALRLAKEIGGDTFKEVLLQLELTR